MSMFDNLKSKLGIDTEADSYIDDTEDEIFAGGQGAPQQDYEQPEVKQHSNKVVNINATTQLQGVLVKPERFEDASTIADQLNAKRTVVLNLESTNKEVSRRLVDFLSGVAYAIKHLNPKVKVYGVQAAGAASMVESQKAGEPIMLDRADTFADGIAVKHPGDLTYELVKEYVDEIVTVSEDEIAAAKSAIKTLGGHIVKVEDYTIPTSDVVHRLVIVEKVSPTPRAYPRAFAKIKKAPL